MIPRNRLLAAAAACLAAATGVYLLAVRTTRGQIVENLAMEGRPIEEWWVHDPTSERLGAVATVLAVGGAVAVVVWAARQVSVRSGVVVAASIAAALAITEVLKHVVIHRPTLVAVGDRVYLEPNTFPSGHSTVAVSAAIAAVALAPRGRRAVAAAVGAAYAAAVGLAMLAAGAHRPADAVGAALVSTAVFLAAGAWGAGPAAAPRVPRSALVAALAGVAVAAALVLAVLVLSDAVGHGPLTDAEIARTRTIGGLVEGSATVAAIGAYACLTRPVTQGA
jgi:membrane-associated phospholipid phosphatase